MEGTTFKTKSLSLSLSLTLTHTSSGFTTHTKGSESLNRPESDLLMAAESKRLEGQRLLTFFEP